MTMTPTELRAAIEAILFVSGEPVRLEDLQEAFPDETKEAVEAALTELETGFREREGGFILEKAAGGYRFATRAELDSYLRKFYAKKNEGRLSMAGLETLAIIAYRQPMTLPEINDIRGVNCAGVIRTLLDRKMIRIAGRKNVVGSPFLYRTTRDFLLHFGLASIQDLPRLEEFSEILGESFSEELLGAPRLEEGEILDATSEDEGAPAASEQELNPELESESADEKELYTLDGDESLDEEEDDLSAQPPFTQEGETRADAGDRELAAQDDDLETDREAVESEANERS